MTENTIPMGQGVLKIFWDIDDLFGVLMTQKALGATNVKFDINSAPASSRDAGPSVIRFYKVLSQEEVNAKEIAYHEEQLRKLKGQ